MWKNLSNPFAAFAGKNAANDKQKELQDGISTLTAGKTDEQKAHEQRAKDRNATYAAKKKEREERKKKLASQWAENKK